MFLLEVEDEKGRRILNLGNFKNMHISDVGGHFYLEIIYGRSQESEYIGPYPAERKAKEALDWLVQGIRTECNGDDPYLFLRVK